MIPVDFSKGGEIYPDIAEELKDLDIGVLGMCINSIHNGPYNRVRYAGIGNVGEYEFSARIGFTIRKGIYIPYFLE